MGREYRVEPLVGARRLISRAAAQLDALLAKPGEDRRPVDRARPEPHHPLAETRAAALGALAVPRLVLSGSLRPVALAVVARPALAGLACRLRARHDAPGAVDGRVEQRLGVGRLDAAENHRRLAHGGSDKAFLARERRRAALPHHPDVDTAVRLAPGVVVVIVHLVGRRRAEDLEHLRDDRIAPRIGIFAGQGHRLDVGLPELAVDAEEDRRAVHLALRRVLPEALAFRERQEAARRLVAEAARAEVDADPDVSIVAVEEVDVVVPRADGPELFRRELVEPALGRERRCLDRVQHAGLHGHGVLEADAEADLVHDGVHEAGQGRLHVGGEQVGADRLVAAADIEADSRRADVIGVGERAADGLRVADVAIRAEDPGERVAGRRAAFELLHGARVDVAADGDRDAASHGRILPRAGRAWPLRRSAWREQDSNLRRLSQRIYSPSPLTARESRPRPGRILSRAAWKHRRGLSAPAGPNRLARVAEALGLGERLELLEGVVLDLADALARDVEGAADLLQRVRTGAREAEAHLDDLALALREGVERLAHVLAAQVRRRGLERGLGVLVLDEVAELGLLLLADRLLQRDRLLGHAQDLAHLARGALELTRDLLRGRLPAELLNELALDVDDLVELLDHVDRDADRPALVRDRARHGLADPPRRVGGELVAAPVVELLDRADQPERALLDQVQERQAAAEVALGDRDDEAQVGLDHLLLGVQVAALDALRERDLAVGGQQLHAADRPQVEAQRVERGLDREVALRLARRVSSLSLGPAPRRLEASAFGGREPAVRADDVDPLALEPGMQLCDLLLRDLHLFQRGGDLLEGQEPALLAFGDERTELVDLRDGRVARQQCVSLACQTLIFRAELSSALCGFVPNAALRALCLWKRFPLRGLDRARPGNKSLNRCSAGGCRVPSAFVARKSALALAKPWGGRDAFWAWQGKTAPLPWPVWTNIRVLPSPSRTSRPVSPRSRCPCRASA